MKEYVYYSNARNYFVTIDFKAPYVYIDSHIEGKLVYSYFYEFIGEL